MSLMDPLADALTNIRNNELQVNDSCVISPASKLIGEVLSTMQKENYIGNFEYIDDNRAGKFNACSIAASLSRNACTSRK